MKTVRLENNFVVEIIPEYALPVETWYGTEFAAKCTEAPDNVVQGWKYNTETKTFSDPSISSIDELRVAALERISGKCSAAIYSGVDVNGKHYTLSKNEQDALAIAQTKVDKGATAVIYGDGLTDAATITALSQAAYEWGVVCTTYYAYLKQYIAAETDVDKLAAIDFGKALPDSYMQQLAALLKSAGIDITKYVAVLTGG